MLNFRSLRLSRLVAPGSIEGGGGLGLLLAFPLPASEALLVPLLRFLSLTLVLPVPPPCGGLCRRGGATPIAHGPEAETAVAAGGWMPTAAAAGGGGEDIPTACPVGIILAGYK